jgi:hypothetical protein
MNSYPRSASVLFAWLLGGCASYPPTTIEATDRSVTLPSVRIGWSFAKGTEAPSVPHTGHGLEIGATGGRGADSQSLVAGQRPVQFGSVTFTAPQTLQHEFDFAFYDVSYRWRKFPEGSPVGFEVLAGAGYAEIDFTVSSPTQRAVEKMSSTGATATVGLIWRMLPSTSFHARLSGYRSGTSNAVAQADRVELYVAQALGRNAVARAGYARWRAETDRIGSSNVALEFHGPTLGVELQF